MNQRSDIDGVLRHWMDDGPTRMPDRIVDVVADRISVERQRRGWRLLRRLPMSPFFKLGIAAAAALVVVVVGWNLLPERPGPGSDRGPTPSPTLGPSPTPIVCEDDIPGCAGALGAGAHQTAHFSPGFEFSTPAGWENTIDIEMLFTLWPDDAVYSTPADLIMVWADVVPAERGESCELVAKPGARGDVAGWIAYLTSHPGLIATNVRSVDLNGSTGQSVDLATNVEWTPACPGDVADKVVPLVKAPGENPADGYGQRSGVRTRYYAIQLGNQTVVISTHIYDSPDEAAFTEGADVAESVIETFSWACKADSPPGPCWGRPDASGNPATPPPTP